MVQLGMAQLILGAVLAVCLAVGVPAAQAAPTVLNFDELQYGEELSGQYTGLGVVFGTADGQPIHVRCPVLPAPFTGPNAVRGVHDTNADIIATFSKDIYSVSVTMGDNVNLWEIGEDTDDLFLRLYDSSDNLLASEEYSLVPPEGGYTLGASSFHPVAYARFNSTGDYPGTVYFDNFGFDTEAPAVPVPPAVLLFGSGLTGLAGWRFRRR
ncbi:MAG: hypothetical protein V2A77_09195 [Pseudomonadota bacterium]